VTPGPSLSCDDPPVAFEIRLFAADDADDVIALALRVITVDPDHQRRGLATALTQAATVWLRELAKRPVLLVVVAGALLQVSPGAVLAENPVRTRAQPAASRYKFEDLTITRQLAADGKPISGFVSYFRLNRALPFAPRGKFEGVKKAARVCSRRTSR
jgi:hypothetical protein